MTARTRWRRNTEDWHAIADLATAPPLRHAQSIPPHPRLISEAGQPEMSNVYRCPGKAGTPKTLVTALLRSFKLI
jgi:hypothetical protein